MSAADIATVNSSFEDAVRRGDVEAIANLYGPDAVVLAPDGPIVKGREGIRQLWMSDQRAWIEKHAARVSRTRDRRRYRNEVGNATLSMVPTGGKNETAEVKFLVIWKRSDGKWRLHRDIWNTRSV